MFEEIQQENVPVLIGGKAVKPGDIIVGDDGGVIIIISPAIAEENALAIRISCENYINHI